MAIGSGGRPAQLRVDVDVDTDKASTQFSGLGSIVTGAAAGITASITSMATNALGQLGGLAIQFGVDVVNAALDAEDAADHMERVFQGSARSIIEAWADVAPETFGVVSTEFEEAATKFGRVLTNMGIGQGDAANLIVETAKLAADMAETYGLKWGDAFEALSAAARGKFKGLSQFTGTISDEMIAQAQAAIEAADPTGVGESAETVLARLRTVFDLLGGTRGAFKADLEDADGAAENLGVQLEQLKIDIGVELLPVLAEMAPIIKDFADTIKNNEETIKKFGELVLLVMRAVVLGVNMAIIIIDIMRDATAVAGQQIANAWSIIVLAFDLGVRAIGYVIGVAITIFRILQSAWDALWRGMVNTVNVVIGLITIAVNAVIGTISRLFDLIRRIPGIGFIPGIGAIFNSMPSSAGSPGGLSVGPTAFGPVALETPSPASVSVTQAPASFNVFGGVTADAIVAALAAYTRRTGSLVQAGIRIQ